MTGGLPVATRPRAIVALCALALGSAFVGAAVDRFMVRKPSVVADNAFHPLSSIVRSPTDADRRELRRQLSQELNLTAAQDSAVERIMSQRAGEFDALREEIRPRVEHLVSDVRFDIDQVLTPEQRDKLHRLQQRGPAPLVSSSKTP